MSVTDVTSTVTELTAEQGHQLFDHAARTELGVSGEEFLRRLNAQDVPDHWPRDAISRLEILLPFAR